MILVDTNVISEPLRPVGNPEITAWLNRESFAGRLFLASTSLGELLSGTATMPLGNRRATLEAKLELELRSRFRGRILPFDEEAARRYGDIAGRARSSGIAISMPDAQIAAIAEARGFTVATRDVRPFRGVGLRVINPWEET